MTGPRHGKPRHDHGALPHAAADVHGTAVPFNDGAHQRQTQPAAFGGLRRPAPEKLFAQVRQIFGMDARPGVRHFYGDERTILKSANLDRVAGPRELERI